jgi:hypothetical protein
MADDTVKFISMQHQESASVFGFMNGVKLNINSVKMHACMFSKLLIMIAGYVDNTHAFFSFVDHPLHDITVQGGSIKAAFEFP